jgi:hypothetical protein
VSKSSRTIPEGTVESDWNWRERLRTQSTDTAGGGVDVLVDRGARTRQVTGTGLIE